METRVTVLNFQPSTSIPVVHVSQYDVGVPLRFILYDGSSPADIEGGSQASVVMTATRPSGTGFTVPCTIIASNIVSIDTTEAMTIEFGSMEAEIRYTNNGTTVGTGNFIFDVEAAAHADYIIDEDHAEWVRISQEVQSNATNAQRAETNAQSWAQQALSTVSQAHDYAEGAVEAAATATRMRNEAVTAKNQAEAAEDNANASALNASDSADAAQLAADDAEAYAVGTRGGEPVTSTDPTYHNNAKYYAEQGGAANLAQTFDASTAYAADDYVLYNSKLWRFTTAHAAGAWNASHVAEVKAMDEVSDLKGDFSETVRFTAQTLTDAQKTQAKENLGIGSGEGLSEEAKEALSLCFRHVAWSDTNGREYYETLMDALGILDQNTIYKLVNPFVSTGFSTVNTGISLNSNTSKYTICGRFVVEKNKSINTYGIIFSIKPMAELEAHYNILTTVNSGKQVLSGFGVPWDITDSTDGKYVLGVIYSFVLIFDIDNLSSTIYLYNTISQTTAIYSREYTSNLLLNTPFYLGKEYGTGYDGFYGAIQDFVVKNNEISSSEINEYLHNSHRKKSKNIIFEIGNIDTSGNNDDTNSRRIRSKEYINIETNAVQVIGCPFASSWYAYGNNGSERVSIFVARCYDESYSYIGTTELVGSNNIGDTFNLISGTKYVRFIIQKSGTYYYTNGFSSEATRPLVINGYSYYITEEE